MDYVFREPYKMGLLQSSSFVVLGGILAVSASALSAQSGALEGVFGPESESRRHPLALEQSSPQFYPSRAGIRRESLRLLASDPQNKSLADTDIESKIRELVLRHREGARRMAHGLLRKWRSTIEHDELYSLVDLCLCEAARRFNPSKGAHFTTFLFYHLRGALVKAVVSRSSPRCIYIEDYERPMKNVTEAGLSCFRSIGSGHEAWQPSSAVSEQSVELDELIFRKQVVRRVISVCGRLRGQEREIARRLFLAQQEIQQVVNETGLSRGHVFRLRNRALAKVRKGLERRLAPTPSC